LLQLRKQHRCRRFRRNRVSCRSTAQPPNPPLSRKTMSIASSPNRCGGAITGTGDGTAVIGVGDGVTGAGIGTTVTGAATGGDIRGLPQFLHNSEK
jgi:hypothetical protein